MYNDDDYKDEEETTSSQSDNKLLDFYNANKKMIWILGGIIVFILIVSMFMGGCSNNNTIPVEPNLIISSNSEKISINGSTQVFAKVEGNDQAVFKWTSSDPNVATVSGTGNSNTAVVTGINYGTAIITVTYVQNGQTYSQKCEVVVAEGNPNVNITQVSFQDGELMIRVGDTFKLPVIVTPSDGYIKSISFESYNKDIVEVNDDGLVKALKVGKAKVKVTINNEFNSEINVHVLDKNVIAQIIVNPTNIQFLDNLLEIEVDESVQLEYEYQPFDATLADLNWRSSAPEVATVVNGTVSGVKAGTAEITVEALNGLTGSMIVKVVPKTVAVESVQIMSSTSITLNVGSTSTIVASVNPSDATNKGLNYQSLNPSVASVDSNGNIRAISEGNAQITVTSVDGEKTATVNVVVISNSSSGGSGGSGGSSGVGSIKFRDANDNSLANSVSSAFENNNTSPVTVSRSSGNVNKLKYCVQKCSNSDDCGNPTCTPSTEISMGDSIAFTQGNGIYVIKSIKYSGSQSEDVKLKYVNIGGVTSFDGTTGNEACYLVNGAYKWTTETAAKAADSSATIVSNRGTRGECEGSGGEQGNQPSQDNKIIGTITNIAGPTLIGNIINDRVVVESISKKHFNYMYYCISENGNCNVDVHTTKNSIRDYTLASGEWCYKGSKNTTYIIKFTTSGNRFQHCVIGKKGDYISYIVEFTDGSKSQQLNLQLK